MAIDSLRKRASVASLGLAFLGPSVVPDGTLGQADRQTVAHSYYGILAGSAIVEIGGTAQLEAYSATGGITRERILGATSQITAYSSTGGITLERVIGGTSQLEAYSSSGGIQVAELVEPPYWRKIYMEAENRVVSAESESRTLSMKAEDRTIR